MKVILSANFCFDRLLNDNFSLQDQFIIQRTSDENWKMISSPAIVGFCDESQNSPA